jgi:flagellar basal body-associated protein FliL
MLYEFRTTVGSGSEVVYCTLDYESDEDGVYNTELTKVMFENKNILWCLTETTQSELEMEGIKALEEPKDD